MEDESIELRVNGKFLRIRHGTNLMGLLEEIGLAPEGTAVLRCGAVIGRDEYVDTFLKDDDDLEIVQMVGGG